MIWQPVVPLLCALAFEPPPHALDQYLQATILSVSTTEIHGSMRLIPGVLVFSTVFHRIDTNHDGTLSAAERDAYARAVLGEAVLARDGVPLVPRLLSATFPPVEEMKEGIGAITIEFVAPVPSTPAEHLVTFENHHMSAISAYLVNALVPSDTLIHLGAQVRNQDQSRYQLAYREGAPINTGMAAWWDRAHAITGVAKGFPSMFRLGARHIAEGTDHLLFLLTLLLPAPFIAARSRWRRRAGVRVTVTRNVRVVTAFTVGHSVTLALAAFGVVHVPSRPIEVLIAVSILVSAVHALRPIFAGKEPVIAAGFGLVHGLAFASAIDPLGLALGARLISILAFNIGIEAMQLVVIAATLPSLILLSRTPVYAAFRVAGAAVAGCAASMWIIERTTGLETPVDLIVNAVAASGAWAAAGLGALALAAWAFHQRDGASPPESARDTSPGVERFPGAVAN